MELLLPPHRKLQNAGNPPIAILADQLRELGTSTGHHNLAMQTVDCAGLLLVEVKESVIFYLSIWRNIHQADGLSNPVLMHFASALECFSVPSCRAFPSNEHAIVRSEKHSSKRRSL